MPHDLREAIKTFLAAGTMLLESLDKLAQLGIKHIEEDQERKVSKTPGRHSHGPGKKDMA